MVFNEHHKLILYTVLVGTQVLLFKYLYGEVGLVVKISNIIDVYMAAHYLLWCYFVQSNDSVVSSPPRGSDGRLIYFYIADENGEIDEGFEELCVTFKGYGVDELRMKLEDELGIDGISVCGRLNGKLYPLRLQLPPNNTTMHVIVVPPSSQGISSY